jgi:hypothetical protein
MKVALIAAPALLGDQICLHHHSSNVFLRDTFCDRASHPRESIVDGARVRQQSRLLPGSPTLESHRQSLLQVSVRFEAIDKLPRNALGKVQKHLLCRGS